ncbi:hypothetical protein D3C72_2497540 [compost metagenome]
MNSTQVRACGTSMTKVPSGASSVSIPSMKPCRSSMWFSVLVVTMTWAGPYRARISRAESRVK